MATHALPTTAFDTSGQVRKDSARNTVIEDRPQVSIRRAPPQRLPDRPSIVSPLSDSFPTPRANTSYAPVEDKAVSPSSSDTQSDEDSMWSKRSHGSPESGFDELYDISESEVDDLPIKLSSSVKKRIKMDKPGRYPSLVIPSPSEWPTIQKFKSIATPLSPPPTIPLSPGILYKLQHQSLHVPGSSGAPSLDGSMTSEELAVSSCPSTPDIQRPEEGEGDWELPVQLDPVAHYLLQQMHPDGEAAEQRETVIELPEEAMSEMKQVVESPPITGRGRILGVQTSNLTKPTEPKSGGTDDEVAQLSIPSPGGFFASLDQSVRLTWSAIPPAPTTGVATSFYGVPFRNEPADDIPPVPPLPAGTASHSHGVLWRDRPQDPVEQTISVPSPIVEDIEEDPVTARKVVFSPREVSSRIEEIEVGYVTALEESANENIGRTQLWLRAQTDYMKAICEDEEVADIFRDIEDAVPRTPIDSSVEPTDGSPSKKSVRFADAADPALEKFKAEQPKRISPIHDGTFWQGWRHNKRSQRARDVFQHRQARAEAEHVRRTSCSMGHLQQLQGKYEFTIAHRPAPSRPISSFLPPTTDDEKKEVILRVERERQALEQMQSSSWALSAQKEVIGGRLLTSPIVSSFKVRHDVQILDLAGQVHCSWAWTVAAEHPDANVYTTVCSDAEAHVAESSLHGPVNHYVVAAPKQWELPFAEEMFDVISARHLYAYLKTMWPRGQAADEWDLTLRECFRVLKPGGYFEFDLLDAELAHPEQAAQAMGVEFAFNLKTRGYDPCAGKSFLPRLKRAGFGDIKRAWMVFPVADVLPRWTDLGKTPGSGSSGATVTPGAKRDDYFGPSASERVIGPEGEVQYYEPAVTGSTRDVRAMTGLVGARMWEQWMLKLNGEMGRSEERCLEGVSKALEEGGKGTAGWRCLVGWARKPC